MKTLACGICAPLCLSLFACDPAASELGAKAHLASALSTTEADTGPVITLPDPCYTSAANATTDLGSYSILVQSQGQGQGQMPPPPSSPLFLACTAYVADFTIGAGSLPPPDPPADVYDPAVIVGGSASFYEQYLTSSTDCSKLQGRIEILQQKSGTSSFVSVKSGTVKGVWSYGKCYLDKAFPTTGFEIPSSGVDKYRVKISASKNGVPVQVTAFMYRASHTILR